MNPGPTPSAGQPLALAAGLAVVAVWGANFAVQKALFGVLPPGAFLFARYLLMPLCAAALLLAVNRGHWPRLPRRDALQLAGLGVLGHTLHASMVTCGIHWSTALSSALIMACGPVFTLLILHHAGLETLTRRQVAGVAVAAAGVLGFLSDKLLGRQWASLASAFLGWLVWCWVNEQRGVGRTAPLQYLMLLVAGVVAWWAAGERFNTVKLLGAAVTLAGVALVQISARPALPAPRQPAD